MTGPAATRGPRSAAPVPAAAGLAALLADATERLRLAGVASPRANAEQLAAFVLDVHRSRLVLVTELPAAAAERFAELVRRRAARAPLQHLTGVAGFRYLDLAVGPGVFVPRPETESVVGWAIDWLRNRAGAGAGAGAGPVCVDLCAGSGAIALSLASEVPGAQVHAVEVDAAALAWLRRNVTASGRAVEVHEADVRAEPPASLARLAGSVDLVVSNPPYLPDADRAAVEPEVGEHDPALALWGGPDGLDVVRSVMELAARLLRPGGGLVVEHADGHGAAAVALARADGRWTDIGDHPDLAGRDRFITARRAAAGSGAARQDGGAGRAARPGDWKDG
ncbi:peptide chain release factor N(5)-glutamine methyltransferase [Frankia sp. AgB32]|uniref:peptide chain release factor N(5)-glutamine methyltransferase n=1 Tax=Frankia sp. AgB32 TaxID=631119 RepID=UPI00200C1EF5|nr:peptide chain release factor N(5)-glutamine methyltransferase [Frankia sp. AgB32]MCK9896107.1 peptide chain release factor N(5)-glutamine methyltransferase [Frankia sp. AgB32]